MPPAPLPAGRVLIAFTGNTLQWGATFTAIDSHPSLVTRYSIDRGRQFELDRTDTGRATVEIADKDGLLDPTNSSGPYYNRIEPLKQCAIQRFNPVNGTWYTRFRGFIQELDYSFDPSQKVNRLTIQLVDIFEVLAAIELQPGKAGQSPPAGSSAEIFFEDHTVQGRIESVLGPTPAGVGIPADYWYVFSGNVRLWETAYSTGENVLTVVQEAADAEWPGVANVAVDRFGRLFFHGRLARFDPAAVLAGAGVPDLWEYVDWHAGDGAAVLAGPPIAQLRRFAFNRGLSKIINQASAAPMWTGTDMHQPTTDERKLQVVEDATSIGLYGIRSWTSNDLQTKESLESGAAPADSLTETKRFATYYVNNYKEPHNRVTELAFRTVRPGYPGAGETWDLLSRVDISHRLEVTVGSPGGGGFNAEPFYVEGVHEQVNPLNATYDDVTVSLDLSPAGYFSDHSMFPEVPT